jgi:hypothetical protein
MQPGSPADSERPPLAAMERGPSAPGLRPPLAGAREGAILVLTIVLVILMTLVAIAVATNTAGELSVSSNTDNGRKAFIQADSALRISVIIARILLFPSTGDLSSFLTGGGDLEIEANADDFDLALLRWNLENTRYGDRYLIAGARTSGIDVGGSTRRPLITFRQKSPIDPAKKRVVATSAVSLDFAESSLAGSSLGQVTYRDQGAGKRTIIIVTTDGRVPTGSDFSSSEEGSFFDGSADTTHAILTTAFQEVQNPAGDGPAAGRKAGPKAWPGRLRPLGSLLSGPPFGAALRSGIKPRQSQGRQAEPPESPSGAEAGRPRGGVPRPGPPASPLRPRTPKPSPKTRAPANGAGANHHAPDHQARDLKA